MATIPEILSRLAERFCSMRTGTVTTLNTTTATVEVVVGEALVPMTYLASTVPVVGQQVQVIRQGATWLCLGATAYQPPPEG